MQGRKTSARHAHMRRTNNPNENARSELVSVSLFFTFALCGLDADLLVILLQSGEVLASFAELALFHALSDIPMDESTLGVHEIELVVDAREHLRDRGGVADHTARTHDLGQVATWHHSRRLVVDAALEPGWAPVDKLDSALSLDRCHSSVHVLGHDVAAIHHAARHVLAVTRVALHEHR